MEEELQRITLFDVPMLFSNGRIDPDSLPDGIFRYDLRGSDYDPGYPITIENQVIVNHAGTVLTAFPLELPDGERLRLGEEMSFDGGTATVEQYLEEMDRLIRDTELDKLDSAVGRANEDLYLGGSTDRYAIYQLKPHSSLAKLHFMPIDYLRKHGMQVDGDNYDYVYGGLLPDGVTLEDIFRRFNLHIPEGYCGHFLSVSDVVVCLKDGKAQAYYVDNFGFAEVEGFVQQRRQYTERQHVVEDSYLADLTALPERSDTRRTSPKNRGTKKER